MITTTPRTIDAAAGLLLAAALCSAGAAAANAEQRTSSTISYSTGQAPAREQRDSLLEQAAADVEDALVRSGYRMESQPKALLAGTAATHIHEISLYDAATELISDFDYDGFYHRFSVTLDVDTVYDVSYVYAKLYLSYEGGPWNHYATSDDYHIYGDSPADTFTIETELADGFPSGYYDVRIVLFDADTGRWIDDYGPYYDSSLSTVPLEDAYRDDGYDGGYHEGSVEVGVVYGSGSLGGFWCVLPLLLAGARRMAAAVK